MMAGNRSRQIPPAAIKEPPAGFLFPGPALIDFRPGTDENQMAPLAAGIARPPAQA
jgi:hypothetical protein